MKDVEIPPAVPKPKTPQQERNAKIWLELYKAALMGGTENDGADFKADYGVKEYNKRLKGE